MTAVRRESHSTRCPGPVDVWSSPSGRMEVQFCEECDGYAITADGNRLKSYAGGAQRAAPDRGPRGRCAAFPARARGGAPAVRPHLNGRRLAKGGANALLTNRAGQPDTSRHR